MEFKPEIQRSKKRKTISISVYPNLKVKILAPQKTQEYKILEFFNKKKPWILKHLQKFKNSNFINIQKKEYKENEKFTLFGEQFLLKIQPANKAKIELDFENGFLILGVRKNANVKTSFFKALIEFGRNFFAERLEICFKTFSQIYKYKKPDLIVKKLKSRWGALKGSEITLNLTLIHTPVNLIDYVIFHELCHLRHKNHGEGFYKMQSEFVPNWKELKKYLTTFHEEINSYF